MTTTRPAITMEQFLDIAGNHTHDEATRLLLAFDGDSLRERTNERYGADWAKKLVMHSSDHISALTKLLGREPTYLEIYDSNSGRILVEATHTTGMGTINAARRLFEAENPPAPVPVPPSPPAPPAQPPAPPIGPPAPVVVEPPPQPAPPLAGPPTTKPALSAESQATAAWLRDAVATWKTPKGQKVFGANQSKRVNALLDEVAEKLG